MDKNRRTVLAVVLLAAIGGALTVSRLVAPAAVAASNGMREAAGLGALSPYMVPMPPNPGLEFSTNRAIVLARNPFQGSRLPRSGLSTSFAAHSTMGTQPTQAEDAGWNVSAILISESQRAAIIDEALVNLGGALRRGARLTAIERDHVIVTDANGRRHVVSVRGGKG